MTNQRTVQRIAVRRTSDGPLLHCIEPWANEFEIPVGTQLILEVEGPAGEDAFLEVEAKSDRLVVFAWTGSTYRLLCEDGTVLD